MTDALKQGDEVRIAGFGTFGISERGERQGRNPQTGAQINIRGVQGRQVHRRQGRQGRAQRRLSRPAPPSGQPCLSPVRHRRRMAPMAKTEGPARGDGQAGILSRQRRWPTASSGSRRKSDETPAGSGKARPSQGDDLNAVKALRGQDWPLACPGLSSVV